jgi:hypothetical protein
MMTVDVEVEDSRLARCLAPRAVDDRDDHLRRRLAALVGAHHMVEGDVLLVRRREETAMAPPLSRSR